MIRTVRKSEVFRKLKRRTGPVVLAVSGGIDSSCMLHLFHKFLQQDDISFEPVVGHVQHDLRDEGPAEDRAFVRSLAEEYGLKFKCRKVHVRSAVDQSSASEEAIARRKRYAALQKICHSVDAGTLVTAHHREDQIQTILMRLWRGTGLQGLCGIRPVRPVGQTEINSEGVNACLNPDPPVGSEFVQLLRPMIHVPKESIQTYVDEHDLSWREDPSNRDLNYRRNLIRERVIPRVRNVLQESYPNLLLRIQHRANDIDRSLRETWMEKEFDVLPQAHVLMISRADVEGCEQMLYPYLLRSIKRFFSLPSTVRYHDFLRLKQLIQDGSTGRQEMLSGGVLLRLEHHYLVARNPSHESQVNTSATDTLDLPGTVEWMGYSITGRPAPQKGRRRRYRTDDWCERIDITRVQGPLRITKRHSGDVMRPLGMSGHKKVKDIMIDRKIPVSLRDCWPVVRDAQGIVWLPGLRVSDRVRITDSSRPCHLFELLCDGGDELDVISPDR